MKRPASRCLNDRGLDETVSVILMVILVIAVAAIIASIVFGLAIFYPKSAYIAVQTEAKNVTPDNWYLSVFHMNGDAAYLNHTLSTNEGMPVDFQFTNVTIGTVIAKPDPADGPETWKPGDTLFVYRNQSGYVWVTKNETLARNGMGLPIGVWRFDVVDRTDDVLIYTKNVGVGVPTPENQYTITASAGTGGSISPSGSVIVNQGSDQAFTITPNTGYVILNVVVDGVSQGAVANYTFSNVVATHTIAATFTTTPTFTITATAGSGGSISPSGSVSVTQGSNQTFTITPNTGYVILNVVVDGVSHGAMATYTFSNVVATHTISATFVINPTPPCGTISGKVYNSIDNSGLFNWQVNCYYKQTSTFILVATTTTDANGNYIFTGRQYSQSAEQYYITETLKSGWVATNPSTGESDKFILNPDPTKCYKTGVNFGNKPA